MPEFAKYDPGTAIGKFGIERQYNDTLAGVDGQRQVVVDNRSQVHQILKTKPATPGKDLELTIDLDLQAVAELAMDGRNGAVVALDPRTGEVLAMVSRPAFDLNKFTGHIKAADWKAIMDNPDHPMMNRAIQSQLAPGSTFKPIMALAGLETGTVDMSWTVHCAGGASFYGGYHKCHKKTGHGAISLHNAIVNSCDVFFYTLGDKMGINPIAYYANMVGFGHPSWNRSARRGIRHRALARMEAAQLPREVVGRRDHLGGHRAGRADGDAGAIGARDRRHRGGRRLAPSAPGAGTGRDRKARPVGARSGSREGCHRRHVRRGERRRHGHRIRQLEGDRGMRQDGHGAGGVGRFGQAEGRGRNGGQRLVRRFRAARGAGNRGGRSVGSREGRPVCRAHRARCVEGLFR